MTTVKKKEKIINEDGYISRTHLWTPQLNKLLRSWKKKTSIRERGHNEMNRKYSRRHYMFGLPVIILSAISTSGIFGTFKECRGNCETEETIRLVIGFINLTHMILSAIHTFTSSNDTAEEHKTAVGEYNSFYQKLESLLTLPTSIRGDPVYVLSDLRKEYNDIIKRSPSLPSKYNAELTFGVSQTSSSILKAPRPGDININALPSKIKKGMLELLKESDPKIARPIIEKISFLSDEEVQIGFDLDAVEPSYNSQRVAIAAAKINAEKERHIQKSLQKTLDRELRRLDSKYDDEYSRFRRSVTKKTTDEDIKRRKHKKQKKKDSNIPNEKSDTVINVED